jgi:hypothetical protein
MTGVRGVDGIPPGPPGPFKKGAMMKTTFTLNANQLQLKAFQRTLQMELECVVKDKVQKAVEEIVNSVVVSVLPKFQIQFLESNDDYGISPKFMVNVEINYDGKPVGKKEIPCAAA